MASPPNVDFESLLIPQPPPGAFARFAQKIHKVAVVKNWRHFVREFKRSPAPTGETVHVVLRNGVEMLLRFNTQDVAIFHEIFLEGSYGSIDKILKRDSQPVTVIDLGAHIGCFTLRALAAGPHVHIESYEPGQDNLAALKKNILLNRSFDGRCNLYGAAVAGDDGTAQYFTHPSTVCNSLYGEGEGSEIQVVSLKTVISRCKHPIALLKIDIEGAEYDLLSGSSPDDWSDIPLIMAEVHPDPSGKSNEISWLKAMYDLGYTDQTREYSTVLLRRRATSPEF